MARRILITGASGFLGGWLVATASHRFEVHAVHRRSHFAEAPGVWHQCDLTDRSRVHELVREIRPDVVVHAAAEANLDWCEAHREQAYAANVVATRILAQSSAAVAARLIYVSSDMVFDGVKGNYAEDDPVNPISYYGHTKVEAERAVVECARNYVIVRMALMFGDPMYGGSSFSVWLEQEMRRGSRVRLFTDQFRTPIWVGTAAAAILELADSPFVGILHLGGTERIDRFSFGRVLAGELGLDDRLLEPAQLGSVPLLAPRPQDLSLRVDRARSVLRTPLQDVRAGLKELVRWRTGRERARGSLENGVAHARP